MNNEEINLDFLDNIKIDDEIDNDIEIDESNFSRLFVGQKRFEKQYEVTKEEILERYPYNLKNENIK